MSGAEAVVQAPTGAFSGERYTHAEYFPDEAFTRSAAEGVAR